MNCRRRFEKNRNQVTWETIYDVFPLIPAFLKYHKLKNLETNIFFPLLAADLDLWCGWITLLCSLELAWHLLWAGYFSLCFCWLYVISDIINCSKLSYPNTAKMQHRQMIWICCYLQHEVLFPGRFTSSSVYCSAFQIMDFQNNIGIECIWKSSNKNI